MTDTIDIDTDGYPPGSGPPGRTLPEDEALRLIAERQFGVLVAVKPDGHPHPTNVVYAWAPEERVARISTTATRIKVRHLRRHPSCALHVSGGTFWSFAVAEGEAELSPVSTEAGDETGLELLRMTPQFDKPETRAAFLEQMVIDQRLVIRVRVSRAYGLSLLPD